MTQVEQATSNASAGQPSHLDLALRLDRGNERFAVIEEKLGKISEQLECLPEMRKDIAATKEIVEAWGAIKTIGKFFKWVSGVLGGMLLVFAVMKAGAKGLL